MKLVPNLLSARIRQVPYNPSSYRCRFEPVHWWYCKASLYPFKRNWRAVLPAVRPPSQHENAAPAHWCTGIAQHAFLLIRGLLFRLCCKRNDVWDGGFSIPRNRERGARATAQMESGAGMTRATIYVPASFPPSPESDLFRFRAAHADIRTFSDRRFVD